MQDRVFAQRSHHESVGALGRQSKKQRSKEGPAEVEEQSAHGALYHGGEQVPLL